MQMNGRTIRVVLPILVLVIGFLSFPYQGASHATGRYDVVTSTKGFAKMSEMTKDVIRGRKMLLDEISKEYYGSKFVAFTEDYRGPRRHPPKNN